MSRIRWILPCLATVVLFAVVSCVTGKKEYDAGMQLYANERYQEAIAYLEQAIELEPNNTEYQKALAEIKGSLVSKHVEEGLKTLNVTGVLTVSRLDAAKERLRHAQQVDPLDDRVKRLENTVKNREASFLSEVRELYRSSVADMDEGEWLKAYFKLQQISNRYPNYENTQQMMVETTTKGHQDFYEKGRNAFENEDFGKAREYLKNALSLNGGHQNTQDLLSLSLERDSAAYFAGKADSLAAKRDWLTAAEYYTRALEYEPDNRELIDRIAQVRLNVLDAVILKAQSLANEGWLYRAIQQYRAITQYPDAEGDYRIGRLADTLLDRCLKVAERFKKAKRHGASWFWYNQVKEINPNHRELFYLTQDVSDPINTRVKKSIAVFPFKSPSYNEDSGAIIANNLITFLFNNASKDIKILERQDLTQIIDEVKLSQATYTAGDGPSKEMRHKGIDRAIVGSVLDYKVESISSQGQKTVRQVTGEEIQDNIEYLNWKARNPDPSKSELASAPPAKIVVPKEQNINYAVARIKKTGFIEINFRIVEIETGENIKVKQIKKTKEAEDESSEGIPDAGIAYDPMDIPTDTEVMKQITNEVVAELGGEALKPLQDLERTYFNEGERLLLRRRNSLDAAEKFVDAIFNENLKMIQGSPLSAKAEDHLVSIFHDFNANNQFDDYWTD